MKFNIFDKDVYLSNSLSLVSIEPKINYFRNAIINTTDISVILDLKYLFKRTYPESEINFVLQSDIIRDKLFVSPFISEVKVNSYTNRDTNMFPDDSVLYVPIKKFFNDMNNTIRYEHEFANIIALINLFMETYLGYNEHQIFTLNELKYDWYQKKRFYVEKMQKNYDRKCKINDIFNGETQENINVL